MFETRQRDAGGRLGVLEVKGRRAETPLLLPVINPGLTVIPPAEIRRMGFEAVITNAYIIYRKEELREQALSKGVRGLLGFDGIVMTDSGSYQLYQYGELELSPEEILRFQQAIKSDIGVILDIPTPPDAGYRRAKEDVEETVRRGRSAAKQRDEMMLAGTIQGSTYLELREAAAKAMAEIGFDLYPIGGVVPLMEAYRFSDLAKIIVHAKQGIPASSPAHLFGAGHPIMFAFAAALGCDIFDSAAYFLYAKQGRYITTAGTLRLREMQELPCQCPVCSAYTLEELKKAEETPKLLATHNLHASLMEIKLVREAIRRGALWELVERRARSHPALLSALRALREYPLERYEPLTKRSAFYYSGPESLDRPEVKRHWKRLSRLSSRAENLVLLRQGNLADPRVGSNSQYHVCRVSPVFGIVPTEIEEVYPLSQHLYPEPLDEAQVLMMKKAAQEYAKGFERVYVDRALRSLGLEGENAEGLEIQRDVGLKLRAMAEYQFGAGAGELLFTEPEPRFGRNWRIRQVFESGRLVASIRASDGFIVPSLEGARRLLRLPYPRNRVVVEDEEACRFISEGRSVFAKFIAECDPEIAPGSEVIVVSGEDELIGWGRAVLDARELLSFKRGVGVKVRGSVGELRGRSAQEECT